MIARSIVLALVAFGLGVGSAVAQATNTNALEVGGRFRVTTSSAAQVKGTLVAADDTTLTLVTEGRGAPEQKFKRSEVMKLEVARGKKSHWKVGALVGVAAGVALGGACNSGDTYCEGVPFFLVAVGAGGATGAGLGALIRTTRWETMPPERSTVGVTPVPGRGFRVTARLRF